MSELRVKGERKLHWYHETPKRRRWIVDTLAELAALHLVVVRAGLPGERSEKRRRKCLEKLLYELHRAGVGHVSVEARQQKQNGRDRDLLAALRARRQLPAILRMDHVDGPAEPLLWAPDAVAGAVVADRCGTPEYLKEIGHLVGIHEIYP